MTEFADRPYAMVAGAKRPRRSLRLSRLAVPAALIVAGVLAGLLAFDLYAPQPPAGVSTSTAKSVAIATARPYSRLLDPGYSLGAAPQALGRDAPLAAGFRPAFSQPEPRIEPGALSAKAEAAPELALPPLAQERATIVEMTHFPAPRPRDLRLPATPEPPRVATPQQPRRSSRTAALPAQSEDNRSFFEKLFGVQKPTGQALAYAAPQDEVIDASRGRRLSPMVAPPVTTAQATAIYDISARVVHMPNGDKLEAHSGLGEHMDDPRYVHLRMRGATPPHTYTLSMREQPFHGVRALRMNPVGGSRAIHGRDGLLTHSYLLGPRGDSNGCVSFRDYERFLQAYLRGEVKRLIVVASLS